MPKQISNNFFLNYIYLVLDFKNIETLIKIIKISKNKNKNKNNWY